MSLPPTDEIPASSGHAGRLVRPRTSMDEVSANAPQNEGENRNQENDPLSYSDAATHNMRDSITRRREDAELPYENYEDGSSTEICALKLDSDKIDELAYDYRAETCISPSRESTLPNEHYEKTVKGDGPPSKNEDESRCKSSRGKKTYRKKPDGIIVDLSDDVYGTSRNGIKINVISMHNLPEAKFVAIPAFGLPFKCTKQRRSQQSSTQRRNLRGKYTSNTINSPVLAIFCAKNYNNTRRIEKSARSKRKNQGRLGGYIKRDTIKSVRNTKKIEKVSSNERHLHMENNLQSSHGSDEIHSIECCHYDDNMLMDVDNTQLPTWITEQSDTDVKRHHIIPDFRCSIFNEQHQECRSHDGQDYKTNLSDFNAHVDWPTECFHPEFTDANKRGCAYDSNSEYRHPDINMQRHCCLTRTAGLLKNSAPSEHQSGELGRSESDELRANIPSEFATKADEYFPEAEECGNRCANYDEAAGSAASSIRKCGASKASMCVEPGGIDALRESARSIAHVPRLEIDTRPGRRGRTTAQRKDERTNKSDSQRAADTWDVCARRDGCNGGCYGGRVVAESSCPDQSPGRKGRLGCAAVDAKWKHGSIETDAQQLDYKWKRRIATVDANTRASVDFKEKRDSRYKSEEVIRVQLRESAEIRKRESLQMVEAMSQTRRDNTNAGGERRETRDYSLWTSLQMGKIWSQVHDAYKNIVKLATTSVKHVAKDAPKSGCTHRNPVEVTTVDSSSPCVGRICEETCHKNLIRSQRGEKSKGRQEQGAIEDALGEYREEMSARKSARAIASCWCDAREHVYQNAGQEVNGKSCIFHSEHQRDRYRDIIEFLPRNETYDCDIHLRFPSSGSFAYLKDSAYLRHRNRGGSDKTQRPAKNIDKRQVTASQKSYIREDQSSSTITDLTTIGRESEDNGQPEMHAKSEQIKFREEAGVYRNDEYGLNVTRSGIETGIAADATASSPEADSMGHSSRNEPIPLVSSKESRRSCCASGWPRCAMMMRFWRKRPTIGNKAIANVFKRRSVGRNELSTATRDSALKITQIKSAIVQTTQEGNKGRTYVNVHEQIPDAIVTRILSEFLADGGKKKRRVLMSITLQSESDYDVSAAKRNPSKETETQTSSHEATSAESDAFDRPDERCQAAIAIASKMLRCLTCNKKNCYEIRQSDDSVTLEEALLAEYPERSDDYFAERKTDAENRP